MTETVLVVAPHPDDETLGCGGTLLRLASQGVRLGWLIVTGMTDRYTAEQHRERADTISEVSQAYGFDQVFQLDLPTAALDTVASGQLIEEIGAVLNDFRPDWLMLPHCGDVHSDHRVVFDACMACTKWFRYPFIRRVMSYETLSETDAALPGTNSPAFQPTVFFNIEDQLAAKVRIMSLYQSECGEYPFPRSPEAITALARLRGTQSGYRAAEAFALLRERND